MNDSEDRTVRRIVSWTLKICFCIMLKRVQIWMCFLSFTEVVVELYLSWTFNSNYGQLTRWFSLWTLDELSWGNISKRWHSLKRSSWFLYSTQWHNFTSKNILLLAVISFFKLQFYLVSFPAKMELPLDSNSEIVFTLKLSKTFMKTVENSDHQDAGELIILTKDANQCVGSIAIGNPIQCTCQKDSARITEPVNQVKIPRKRGRKRKCDIAIKNNCEEIANQSISAQVTDEGYQGEPLDLSVKKSDQGRNFEFVGKQKINEMAMDLSVRKKKTFGSFTSASKQPNNCIRSQESTTTQREAVITSTINGPESDFSSEIFQLISSLPNVDSVPSNLEPKPNTAPVPKQRKNSKKLVEPKQPKKG